MTMNKTALLWLRPSMLVVATAILLTACADGASPGPLAPFTASSAAAQASAGTSSANRSAAVDLTACPNLAAPAGSKLALRVHAKGVQIYTWNGVSWTFNGPLATLSADAARNGTVGTHYAGPTWESNSGSKVVGAVIDRCTPDVSAIPWLSLGAVSSEGPGIFNGITFIQRVNTVGGNAPSSPGTIGEEARVSYTTEYLFYRTK
jgi:hypothetical protein